MSPPRHSVVSDKTQVRLSFATWCAVIGSIVYFTITAVGMYHGICKRLDAKMSVQDHDLWVMEARKRTHLDLPYQAEIQYKQQHPDEDQGQ